MADNLQISNPTGGMDKEKDYSYLDQNDYTDAKNIRHITRGGNTTGDAETIYGNEFAWKAYVSGNTISAKNKYIRVAINATNNATSDVTFYTSANGAAITTGTNFNIVAGDITTSLDNCVSRMNSDLSAGGYGNVIEISRQTTNANFGSVVVELGNGGTYSGIDFITVFSNAVVTVTEIVQEALPITYTGENVCIGSKDINSNTFSFWTTRTTLPVTREVIGATNATPIVITEGAEHGLVDGDEVVIQGVPFNTSANGKWIVNVLSTTTYELVGSAGISAATVAVNDVTAINSDQALIETTGAHGLVVGDTVYITGVGGATTVNGTWTVVEVYSTTQFIIDVTVVAAYTAGGTTFRVSGSVHDANGYGEIWWCKKDTALNTWDAFRLLGSIQFGFTTKKQIDVVGEFNASRYELYYTDDYNPPRVFYYSGAFQQDGALNVNANGPGIYEYIGLTEQIMLFNSAPNVSLSVSQLQTGGSLPSGNWRYFCRFGTDETNFTTFSNPSGLINVYSEDIGDPTGIRGDAAGTTTPKINVITVSDIPTYFDYVELVGVLYSGGGVSAYSIKTAALNDSGQITLYHYGNESTETAIDASLLFEQRPNIATALNILSLDQRLLLANTTSYENPDLADWAQDITISAERATLDTLGSNTPTVGFGGEPVFGEYQDPNNVENYIGYCINETYRFGVRLRYAGTDNYTPPYFVGDFTFNTANGLTDLSITDLSTPVSPPTVATSPNPYVIYPQFSNIDFDYVTSSGKSIKEQFDQIEFVRVERNLTNSTILATGLAMLALDNSTNYQTDPAALSQVATIGYYLNPQATYTGTGTERQLLYLMFPDTLLGNRTITQQAGDQIINMGNPTYQILRKAQTSGAGTQFDAIVAELYGDSAATDGTAETVGVDDLVYNAGTQVFSLNGNNYDPAPSSAFNYASYYAAVDTELTDVNGVGDYGVYYVQYYRALANQYGDVAASNYMSTGFFFDIDASSTISTTFDVLGGDTFSQKATFEQTYTDSSNRWGQALAFYAQNAVNSQMRQMGDDASNQVVLPRGNDPDDDWDTRITETGDYRNRELRSYDTGYNAWWLLDVERGFDSDEVQNSDFPTRIWYSNVKPANSLLDNYRIFLPLQYYDLPTSYGEIFSIKSVNGELYSLQPRAFMRQWYNARATINGGDDSGVILLGTTNVFSVGGIVISTFGTKHKWSVVKGKGTNGKDTLYWINTELKNAMKFDSGGSANVSEIRNMKAFFANNLRWADLYNTPADSFGIHGVWNNRYSEVIWTIRANGTDYINEWDVADAGAYSFGTAVKYASTPLYQRNFEQTGNIYTYNNVSSGSTELPTNTSIWTLIDHNDPRWFNEYTLVYCEPKNKWEAFFSHKPTIYMTWNDALLSTAPYYNRGFVYEHDRDFVCRWYEVVDEFSLSGTATKAVNTYTVIGVGTAFTTELQVGYELTDGGSPQNRYVIREIISDTELTIDDNYIVNWGLPSQEVASDAYANPITFSSYYPCQIEDAHLTPVINLQPDVTKWFEAQLYNTEVVPYRTDYTTPTQISFIEQDTFEFYEDYWKTAIQTDSTNNGINNGDTSRLYGKWMLNKISMRYLIYNMVHNFVTKVRYSRRLFNR